MLDVSFVSFVSSGSLVVIAMEGDYADNPIREAVISFLQNCPKNRYGIW